MKACGFDFENTNVFGVFWLSHVRVENARGKRSKQVFVIKVATDQADREI